MCSLHFCAISLRSDLHIQSSMRVSSAGVSPGYHHTTHLLWIHYGKHYNQGFPIRLPVCRASKRNGKPSFESQELRSLFDEITCEDDSPSRASTQYESFLIRGFH